MTMQTTILPQSQRVQSPNDQDITNELTSNAHRVQFMCLRNFLDFFFIFFRSNVEMLIAPNGLCGLAVDKIEMYFYDRRIESIDIII